MIEKTVFGILPDGHEVHQYLMRTASGSSVSIIDYGAIVTSIVVPDKTGKVENVVLNYNSLQGYVCDHSYLGAIVGRYANRISRAQFPLEGNIFHVTMNDGKNHIHGGIKGFNKKLWITKIVESRSNPSISLECTSPDKEEGYPGSVTLTVTYTLTENNEFCIEYSGTTDRTTILNPTHHSYFNLSGTLTRSILDHILHIDSEFITTIDQELIPTGSYTEVRNTPLDFISPTVIGQRIHENHQQLLLGNGYDHNWVLKSADGKIRKVAEIYEQSSGRKMTVSTDQPGLQFYSGNFLSGSAEGNKNALFQNRTGLCLEAQCPPDSPNKPEFPSVVLKPNETYRQTTMYQFSTIS